MRKGVLELQMWESFVMRNGMWYCFGWDLTKNIIRVDTLCNLYGFLRNEVISETDRLGLENVRFNDCVSILVEIVSHGFLGNTVTPISSGQTLIVRDTFHVKLSALWGRSSSCLEERKNYIHCFSYSIMADLKLQGGKETVELKEKTIMGLLDETEMSMGDAVFAGSRAAYVMGDTFYVPRRYLPENGTMTLTIAGGGIEKVLSYNIRGGNHPGRFDWRLFGGLGDH